MQEYVRYLTDVLGIRSILLPAELPRPRLVFLEDEGKSNSQSLDLLAKMREAMKLQPEEILFMELTTTTVSKRLAEIETCEVLVVFSTTLANYLTANFPHRTLLQSPSPYDMLKDPQLKREAWDVLKQAMKHLSIH